MMMLLQTQVNLNPITNVCPSFCCFKY